MTTTADPRDEMQAIVRSLTPDGVNWKFRVNVAARKLGLSFSRAKDFYYADKRTRVSAEELQRAKERIHGGKVQDDERDTNGNGALADLDFGEAGEFDALCMRARFLIAENERHRRELEAILAEIRQRRSGDAGGTDHPAQQDL